MSVRDKFPDLPRRPALNVGDSIQHDGVVCLFDGVKRKDLSRYLQDQYKMTPQEYRIYWRLADSYPMVAPGYTKDPN